MDTMTITMLETKRGSPDGGTVEIYNEGETYDVPVALGEAFLRNKWADKGAPKKRRRGKQSEQDSEGDDDTT